MLGCIYELMHWCLDALILRCTDDTWIYWTMMQWWLDVLMHSCINALMSGCIDGLMHWFTDGLMYRCIGALKNRYIYVLENCCTDALDKLIYTLMHQFLIHRHIDILIPAAGCIDALKNWCNDGWKYYIYIDAQIHWCINWLIDWECACGHFFFYNSEKNKRL